MTTESQLKRHLMLLDKLNRKRLGDQSALDDEQSRLNDFRLEWDSDEHRDAIILYNQGMIKSQSWGIPTNEWSASGIYGYEITEDGIEYLNKNRRDSSSQTLTSVNDGQRTAFVAIWFDDSMNEAYEAGIEPALLRLGYQPIRIDEDLTVDDIMPKVRQRIEECDLLVADLTCGNKGPIGGVYWEAGYAEGIGKPVIFTCRADQASDIHFDLSHKFHIRWETPKQLRDGLKERIPARVQQR